MLAMNRCSWTSCGLVLGRCLAHGVRIVSNFGAANPESAAKRIHALASELGLPKLRIAIV